MCLWQPPARMQLKDNTVFRDMGAGLQEEDNHISLDLDHTSLDLDHTSLDLEVH